MPLPVKIPSTSSTKGRRFSKVQAEAPPVGSVEVRTSPLLSIATHCRSEGQSTPVIWTVPPPCAGLQADAGPVGAVEVKSVFTALPVTQRLGLGQETPRR